MGFDMSTIDKDLFVYKLIVQLRYCSEACGRLLARQRLMDILPKQIHVWQSTPTVANEVAKEELERIRKRMIFARKELESLGTIFPNVLASV